jgi:hypothetical protein
MSKIIQDYIDALLTPLNDDQESNINNCEPVENMIYRHLCENTDS